MSILDLIEPAGPMLLDGHASPFVSAHAHHHRHRAISNLATGAFFGRMMPMPIYVHRPAESAEESAAHEAAETPAQEAAEQATGS